jgi:hypothetical protein
MGQSCEFQVPAKSPVKLNMYDTIRDTIRGSANLTGSPLF